MISHLPNAYKNDFMTPLGLADFPRKPPGSFSPVLNQSDLHCACQVRLLRAPWTPKTVPSSGTEPECWGGTQGLHFCYAVSRDSDATCLAPMESAKAGLSKAEPGFRI